MNWGNRLLVTFVVFAGLMSFLVYKAMHTNFELVEKDYYKNELKFQQVIDGTERANQLGSLVSLSEEEGIVTLEMPDAMKNHRVTGKIWFYCAYDEKKDRHYELSPDNAGIQTFPEYAIAAGTYTVKIDWTEQGLNYHSERKLIVK